MSKKRGFTLIELLVVMAIMGILVTIAMANYQTAQIKARDARRKSDIGQVQKALELYYNDYGKYPVSSAGKIKIGADTYDWKTSTETGDELKDTNDTVYMKELVGDPAAANPNYCYRSTDGSYYQIYAKLENVKDLAVGSYTCQAISYNYGVASSNSAP